MGALTYASYSSIACTYRMLAAVLASTLSSLQQGRVAPVRFVAWLARVPVVEAGVALRVRAEVKEQGTRMWLSMND
jgi:hypothetical protein